jgi:hypothetical protein
VSFWQGLGDIVMALQGFFANDIKLDYGIAYLAHMIALWQIGTQ